MKKIFLGILILCLPVLVLAQQPVYSKVKIYSDSKAPSQLFKTGIAITRFDKKNNCYEAEISQKDLQRLKSEGFRYEVVIPDMTKFYTERFNSPSPDSDKQLNEEWPQPNNFSLGTCGGFCTVDEMLAQLDLMRSLYPSLISVKKKLSDTILTNENRSVYYVRISDNPDVNESEPEVLYTGMHHAREPIGMQHLLYYMWYLLENYNSDPTIKGLVDNTEMYFVPVFNVDGYSYNITNYPDGGGMWRKNRRNSGNGDFGVDVNRNYGYQWGYDDEGSSPDTYSDLYRGTAAFSEPETRMMKYFCNSHNFSIALNYHSFSGLCLYAWGWTDVPSPHEAQFSAYAELLTKENQYTYGPGYTTIYPTNGGSDDWMYGEQSTKPLILSYTPEVGNNSDGFWPQSDRIIPLIKENMLASLTAARLVGNYGVVKDISPFFIHEQSGYLPFEVQRLGMQGGNYTVSVSFPESPFATPGDSKAIQINNVLEKHTDSIFYQLSEPLEMGDTLKYVLTIDNGYFSEQDTVTRVFGFPVTVFNDNLSTSTNWTGTWGLTSEQYFSPTKSMTDSPYATYSAYDNKTIKLANTIELPDVVLMVLQFRAKWDLEKSFDYVQLEISDNNGVSWTPLAGKYTVAGSVNQPYGQPLYDGKVNDWKREAISLNNYMGKNVKFRFHLKADAGVEFDGYYFDDFQVDMLIDATSVSDHMPAGAFLGYPYPNPTKNKFEVSYTLPQNVNQAELVITTPEGKSVSTTHLNPQNNKADINTSHLSPGFYIINIKSANYRSIVRKLVIQ